MIDNNEGCSNFPNWPGASAVYSKAYRILESMATRGCVRKTYGLRLSEPDGPFRIQSWNTGYYCVPNDDMDNLIDALNRGDEEKIKGLLLQAHIYY